MHVDEQIARQATTQAGVISHAQLRVLGVGRGSIARRLEAGRLRRLLHRAYAVGQDALPPDAPLWAAVLAAGDGLGGGVALARRSAGAHLGLLSTRPARVELVTDGRRRGPAGVDLRRTTVPLDGEVVRVDGLPVTCAERTLVDLAPLLPVRVLERALHQADVLRLLDWNRLRRMLERARPGVAVLRRLVEADADAAPTDSWLEEAVLAALDAAGIPRPLTQQPLLGFRVDFLWPQERLVVEADGRAAHLTVRAFEEDRRRDARLVAAGFRVVRFSYRQVREEPAHVAAVVGALVHHPGAPARPRVEHLSVG